ncbi:MAG TPA: hypothetical protein VHS99_18675 [Chloroflexota bacterium]|nr:hypothetical protein [Chloroflexota bacterium]
MTTLVSVTLADQADMRQRLNSDGLAALGLAGPLLAPAWTPTLPAADVASLSFTAAETWHAPLAGMLIPVDDGRVPGLSMLDGTPAADGGPRVALFRIHPQAQLRLERLMRAALEAPGPQPPDRAVRPVPATILIRDPNPQWTPPQHITAGQRWLQPGRVTFHDQRGLIVDPFAFAAALAALIAAQPVLGAPLPAGPPAGTLAAIANLAPAGQFVHAVDLHGRPWSDPGPGRGIGFFTGPATARVPGPRVTGGALQAWTAGAVLAAEDDPADATRPRRAATVRLGWSTNGVLDTAPLTWPPAGPAAAPVRDTLRVAALDLPFHLHGNRSAATRDGVGRADDLTIAEQAPQVRDGSPVALLADGRACLGWFGQVILGLQGGNPANPFTSGPILASTVAFDDGRWPLPVDPTPTGRWPLAPAAVPVAGAPAAVLGQLAALRAGSTAQWVQGSNDVLVTFPAGLPPGVFIRLYPLEVRLGVSPDEQPLLLRHDGPGVFTQAGASALQLRDPFRLGAAPPPATATLRADAVVTWMPATGGAPQTRLIANLEWPVSGSVAPPAAAGANLLAANFWKSTASAPILGAEPRGSFTLATAFADPIAFIQNVVRQLSTDRNPREAPRLPTMARTESLLAIQVQNNAADPFRGVLTGGWLTRETDRHTYPAGNPGGAGESEAHAPGVAAASQLGFDLWVAALHRCRPVVPTEDLANVQNLPNLPLNWVFLQTSAATNPPNPPNQPGTMAGALLQTIPAFVETPELALVPDDDVPAVTAWITNQLGNWVGTGNDPELHRQMTREVRSTKYGRRDAQWALRRALRHARELVYIETPLLGRTAHGGAGDGAPADPLAAVDLITELANRLSIEPGLRVVILLPRTLPFASGFASWAMHFYAARATALQTLQLAGGVIDGRPRVVVAHPMGVPGRPLAIRTTTVIVDDVWCLTGTSTLTRRGLTFDGASDVVLTDRALDRGAGVAIRAHREALMGMHLGLGPGGGPQTAPPPYRVALHQPQSAHAAFADILSQGGAGRLMPLWPGPDPTAPNAALSHPPAVADPDGRGGASLVVTIAGALAGNGQV